MSSRGGGGCLCVAKVPLQGAPCINVHETSIYVAVYLYVANKHGVRERDWAGWVG